MDIQQYPVSEITLSPADYLLQKEMIWHKVPVRLKGFWEALKELHLFKK